MGKGMLPYQSSISCTTHTSTSSRLSHANLTNEPHARRNSSADY